MKFQADIYPRIIRPLVLFAGLAAYALFTLGVALENTPASVTALLFVWMIGFVALVLLPGACMARAWC